MNDSLYRGHSFQCVIIIIVVIILVNVKERRTVFEDSRNLWKRE